MAKERPKRQPLVGAQLEIMQIVWERGEVTVGEVLEILSTRRRVSRNTVQTTLVRLEEKGWLRHRKVANAFRYSAVAERQQTLAQIVANLIDTAFEGSVESLVMALINERRLTKDESRRIRRMIEDFERQRGGP